MEVYLHGIETAMLVELVFSFACRARVWWWAAGRTLGPSLSQVSLSQVSKFGRSDLCQQYLGLACDVLKETLQKVFSVESPAVPGREGGQAGLAGRAERECGVERDQEQSYQHGSRADSDTSTPPHTLNREQTAPAAVSDIPNKLNCR